LSSVESIRGSVPRATAACLRDAPRTRAALLRSVAPMSHRVTEKWMGEPVDTLEDLLREGLFAVCVGINPSTVSVEKGHYYQGSLGQRFYGHLRRVGLLPADAKGWEDDALYKRGVGFTDIVKRATPSAVDVRPEEYKHGKPLLRRKLDTVSPTLVIFTFPKTAKKLFAKTARTGFFDGPAGDRTHYFAMPGPYEKVERREELLDDLEAFISNSRG
jgi:TDG/mug DNA glycosylase family protein